MLMKKISAPNKLINLDFSDSRSRRGTAHSVGSGRHTRIPSWSLPSHHSTTHNQSFFARASPQYPVVSQSTRRNTQPTFVSHATPQHPDLDAVDFSSYHNPVVTKATPGGDFFAQPE